MEDALDSVTANSIEALEGEIMAANKDKWRDFFVKCDPREVDQQVYIVYVYIRYASLRV